MVLVTGITEVFCRLAFFFVLTVHTERSLNWDLEHSVRVSTTFLPTMSSIPGDFSKPTPCKCYASLTAKGPIEPYNITRRACSDNDVVIGVKYAGICHSDIHNVKEEWGPGIFPM